MLTRFLFRLIRQFSSPYRRKLSCHDRILTAIIFTLTFALTVSLVKELTWTIYLFSPHAPSQPWMDLRERAVIIKHLLRFNRSTSDQRIQMLEFGAGSSTFTFSHYVHRYVSIEHSIDYCRILESMAQTQSNRSVTIFYMNRRQSKYFESYRYEQNPPTSDDQPSIQIYCLPPDRLTLLFHGLWEKYSRSTYTMYRAYIDFPSIHLSHSKFDFVLIDGRARPQTAYMVLRQLNGAKAKVFVHDWNRRPAYHIITKEFYDIIDRQIESDQPGGGGLVVLQKKPGVTGLAPIDQIRWKMQGQPIWWI